MLFRSLAFRAAAFGQSVEPAALVGISLRSPPVAAAGNSQLAHVRRVSHESSSFKLPVTSLVCHAVLPNPSLERTSTGMAPRATQYYVASRGAMPVASAQLKR